MTTTESRPDQVTEALAGRLFEAGLAAIELVCTHLGVRLGLYRPLLGRALTSEELAAEAGIDARYAQEWCEQQAAAGVLGVDAVEAPAALRRYTLPAGAEAVLLDPDSPAYLAPMAALVGSVGRVLPQLLQAYRQGTGVPYADYEFHDVQAAFNRPVFNGALVREWLPSMTDLHHRFTAGATIAELGCGGGYAAVALARAYPALRVDGFDTDDASVAAARWLALHEGVADRVRFEVADVAEAPPTAAPRYDAVFAFEMLHDLARPVEALRTARGLVRGPDGAGSGPVIVMDERAGDAFTAPADPIERFLYAASVLHCLPAGRCEAHSAATGTVLRPATVRRYATEAGFTAVTVLPIEHEMFRFYRLEG